MGALAQGLVSTPGSSTEFSILSCFNLPSSTGFVPLKLLCSGCLFLEEVSCSFELTHAADRFHCVMRIKDNLRSTLTLVWNLWWPRFVSSSSWYQTEIQATISSIFLLADVLIQGKIDEKNGQQWQEILKKWDTRLSALFVSIDLKGDGNISYESFQEVSYWCNSKCSLSCISLCDVLCVVRRIFQNVFTYICLTWIHFVL